MLRPANFRQTVCFGQNEVLPANLSVLKQLEASLELSVKLLLARDLAGFEQTTGEQMALLERLDPMPVRGLEPSCSEECTLAAELRAVEMRVLHLGRVQRALLGRAQRCLHVMAQLLAGPGASYAVPAAKGGSPKDRGREPDACRA
jgi:hypothetical protein